MGYLCQEFAVSIPNMTLPTGNVIFGFLLHLAAKTILFIASGINHEWLKIARKKVTLGNRV
jgi:hypothetical protein